MQRLYVVARVEKEEPAPEPSILDQKKIDVGKDAAIEAEVRAARERAVVPRDMRMKQFREMLTEKEV